MIKVYQAWPILNTKATGCNLSGNYFFIYRDYATGSLRGESGYGEPLVYEQVLGLVLKTTFNHEWNAWKSKDASMCWGQILWFTRSADSYVKAIGMTFCGLKCFQEFLVNREMLPRGYGVSDLWFTSSADPKHDSQTGMFDKSGDGVQMLGGVQVTKVINLT